MSMDSVHANADGLRLMRFLEPKSIAVVGASDRPGSLGKRTMDNLSAFTGKLFPVSRRLERIGDLQCYASVADLPEAVDCAVLAVPASAVEAEVAACAARGVGGCVVFASGYTEVGTHEGRLAQERLSAIAREGNMRLLGPNTTGFANFSVGARAGFAEFPGGVAEGQAGVGLVSQSGALGLALAQSAQHGTGISHVLTCGNSADLDVADLVLFLVDQPAAKAIAVTFEGISAPEKLLDAVRHAVVSGKPVVICRVGRSALGSAAVQWHTSTDPHPGHDWDKEFGDAGAMLVRGHEALMETAAFLAKTAMLQRPVGGPRVAILSSSGGAGILAADSADRAGVALAHLGDDTRDRLVAELPSFGSPRNPCDMTAQATSNPQMVTRCAEALFDNVNVHAVVLPWSRAWDSGQFEALSEASGKAGKPLCLLWTTQWLEGPGAEVVEKLPHVALFRSMDACFAALAHWRDDVAG